MVAKFGVRSVLVGALFIAGCGSDTKGSSGQPLTACAGDTNAQVFTAGMSKTSAGGLTIAIESADPAPPVEGFNEWVVRVTDGSGAPVVGANVQLVGKMTHGGLSHGFNPPPGVVELGNGEYQIGDLNRDAGVKAIIFNMGGHWDVTVVVDRTPGGGDAGTSSTAQPETVTFGFCI